MESEWNPRGEDGELQHTEPDWALAPGATGAYYAESVTIPQDWEGEKTIEVRVVSANPALSEGSVVQGEGLTAQPEDLSIEYLLALVANSSLTVGTRKLGLEAQGSYASADVSVVETDKKEDDPSNSGGKSTNPISNAQRDASVSAARSRTPGTGDNSRGTATAAGLAALGGARK